MIGLVTVDDLKRHLRIDHNDEDGLLTGYLVAAERHVFDYCAVDSVPTREGASYVFRAAILLFAADLYERREYAGAGPITFEHPTLRRLLDPYRQLSF